MAAPRPPLLAAPGSGGGGGGGPTVGALAGVGMRMFHGDVFLGEVDVFPMKKGPEGGLPFPSNEIRVSHPLAVRREVPAPRHPADHRALLRAMQTAGQADAAPPEPPPPVHHLLQRVQASVGMLNLRCLAIVFDLDETLIVANTMKSFEDRIEMLSRRMEVEEDPVRIAGMSAEIKRYIEDKELLKEFIDTDTVTDNGRIVGTQKEEVIPVSGGQERVFRPVIRLHERNAILTRINPEIRDTSVFVKLRPAWEDLRSYLTAKGRKRFEVYVCTMAERDYALEMWRLLDPEGSLINLQQLSERVNVFRDRRCHPKMAMVIDDRLQMANAVPVLCVARNVACSVRGGFFREFDESVITKVYEVCYENELLDLPYAPDVGDYLVCEDTVVASNKDNPPIPEGMRGAEVEKRLNGQSYLGDQREGGRLVPASTRASDDEGMAIRGSGGVRNVQSNGGSLAIPPSVFVTVLQKIAQLCDFKVDFRSTVSNGRSMQFSVELCMPFGALNSGSYLAFAPPIAGVANKDTRNSPGSGNGFLEDFACPEVDSAIQEPSGSTLKQDQPNDKLSSVMNLIREHCLEDHHVVFRDQVQNSSSTKSEEYHFQVELAGQIVGRGIGSDREVAKLMAAEEALRTLKSTTDPQIKKYLRPVRCNS
ncbi:hypothetical protein PR202_gb04155 [Eleusine coracana subsp. coracana]|uniref:protein-serine/threonine phosphatase n=1 Tax=Eleusine coracana subsp. coracana TaxID=191504 RepID=A0AAV5E1C9_ELECO|nr:hypothetical protein PR202_gb04155 [Eleusine coracana subsp. coracana]